MLLQAAKFVPLTGAPPPFKMTTFSPGGHAELLYSSHYWDVKPDKVLGGNEDDAADIV